MTTFLIADDHDIVRGGIRALIESRPNWKVIAEVQNGKDAVTETLAKKPDIAILDQSMPMVSGIEATRQIKARQVATEILLFTMHDNDFLVQDALKAGARAFLLKSDAATLLLSAIDALLAHKPFFNGAISEQLLSRFLQNRPAGEDTLTPREKNVIKLVAEGHSNKSMSVILSISPKTVETHRASAMRKLKIRSTAELVRYAIKYRLVES